MTEETRNKLDSLIREHCTAVIYPEDQETLRDFIEAIRFPTERGFDLFWILHTIYVMGSKKGTRKVYADYTKSTVEVVGITDGIVTIERDKSALIVNSSDSNIQVVIRPHKAPIENLTAIDTQP